MKYFYTHLIEIESVSMGLDKLGLSGEQKKHLANLVDSSIHHSILDVVMSELSPPDKRIFLQICKEDDHSKLWKFLNEKIDNIEEKVKKCADDLKLQLHNDLREAREK
ncbi:hypothetical protein HYT74_00275 [Candidatus Daviesbacteria bacterium]|nr:hypothetical protein [Candidatus Daviesbacteria bacterium]